MSAADRMVIVGTGLAAVRAAEGARSAGWSGTIELIGEERHRPYDRPPLSKEFLAAGDDGTFPALRSDESWDALGAKVRAGTAAIGLDPVRRVVATDGGEIGYNRLVIATGSRPKTIPSLRDVPGVHTLHGYDDACALRAALRRAQHLLVVGAGFIGSEIASAARAHDVEVTVVDAASPPLARAVGPLAAARLMDLHVAAGVKLELGTGVRLAADSFGEKPSPDRGVALHLDTGRRLHADAVIVGVGVAPATGWLTDSGVALDPTSGGVICDDHMAGSVPNVWAAGDVAVVDGQPGQHWTAAAEQGFVAGANAAGDRKTVVGVAFAWSTWHGHRIQVVGETGGAGEMTDEVEVGDGLIEYLSGDVVVGAVGIDRPADIAKVRRHLLAANKERRQAPKVS
ncbi:NAD(P)/FAD-dependent oxidoreductase [Gordonia sp. NPDC003429]